jgi:hypothetical protein
MVLISYSSFNMPSHPIHPQKHGNMKEKEQHRSLFDDDFFNDGQYNSFDSFVGLADLEQQMEQRMSKAKGVT